ncbi:MAG: hypothetical protein ACI4FO_07445, partial [Acutalibacteraceae bacterium]
SIQFYDVSKSVECSAQIKTRRGLTVTITVFFHDHLFANVHQQHGLFGVLIVEPAGSVFLNPKNGSFTGAQTAAADVNSDSIVNLLDAIYIQKYVIGIPVDVPINTPLE